VRLKGCYTCTFSAQMTLYRSVSASAGITYPRSQHSSSQPAPGHSSLNLNYAHISKATLTASPNPPTDSREGASLVSNDTNLDQESLAAVTVPAPGLSGFVKASSSTLLDESAGKGTLKLSTQFSVTTELSSRCGDRARRKQQLRRG
jgi:hypothetical protein